MVSGSAAAASHSRRRDGKAPDHSSSKDSSDKNHNHSSSSQQSSQHHQSSFGLPSTARPNRKSNNSDRKSKNKRLGPAIVEEYDSELVTRPKLGKKHIQRSIRQLEATRRERRFHAKVVFREFALEHDEERMPADRLRAYVARVMRTDEEDLQEEAMELVLEEARKKSPEAHDGILSKSGASSAVIKYGEYARHCKDIHKLFEASDNSRDGKLQRGELRKMIEEYEETKHRTTEFCSHVVLFVTEQDLDFVLKSADENHDGDIGPNEVVQAIGAWEELATVKMYDFEHPKLCRGCTVS